MVGTKTFFIVVHGYLANQLNLRLVRLETENDVRSSYSGDPGL